MVLLLPGTVWWFRYSEDVQVFLLHSLKSKRTLGNLTSMSRVQHDKLNRDTIESTC